MNYCLHQLKLIVLFVALLLNSGTSFAGRKEVKAVELYKQGMSAMDAGQCVKAQQHFSAALKVIPRDNKQLRWFGKRTYKYLPNRRLRALKKTCQATLAVKPTAKPIKKTVVLTPLVINLAHGNQLKAQSGKAKISGNVKGSGKLLLLFDDVPVKIEKGRFQQTIPISGQKQQVRLKLSNAKQSITKTVTIIAEALRLSIDQPKNKWATSAKKVLISGKVKGGGDQNQLTINNRLVSLKQGKFSLQQPLVMGVNVIKFVATNGNDVVRMTRKITRYQKLSITLDSDTVHAQGDYVTVSGRVSGGYGRITVKLANKKIVLQKGQFKQSIAMNKQKKIYLVVKAGSEKLTKTIKILADLHPLKLVFSQPMTSLETLQKTIEISGKMMGGQGKLGLMLAGNPIPLNQQNQFKLIQPLALGNNLFTFEGHDKFSRKVTKTVMVKQVKPLAIVLGQGDYVWSKATTVKLAGRVEGGIGKPQLWIDGKQMIVNDNRLFQAILPVRSGETKITLKAQDKTGKTIHKIIRVVGE